MKTHLRVFPVLALLATVGCGGIDIGTSHPDAPVLPGVVQPDDGLPQLPKPQSPAQQLVYFLLSSPEPVLGMTGSSPEPVLGDCENRICNEEEELRRKDEGPKKAPGLDGDPRSSFGF